MRAILWVSVLTVASVTLSGCARNGTDLSPARSVREFVADAYRARPLTEVHNIDDRQINIGSVQPNDARRFLGLSIMDSQKKCTEFVSVMTAGQAGLNTGFNILSIGLSAAAALFTPLSTVRGLAAAATVSQGSLTAINSDFYQQVTVYLFTKQIEEGYGARLAAFEETIRKATSIDATIEFAALTRIHATCSFQTAITQLGERGERPPIRVMLNASDITLGARFKDPQGREYDVVAPGPANRQFIYIVREASGAESRQGPSRDSDIVNLLNNAGATKR